MTVRSYRAAMMAGIAFPVLLFVGTNLALASGPDTKKSDSADAIAKKWVAVVHDHDKRVSMVLGSFVLIVPALALIWFASALRDRLAGPGNPMFGFAMLAAIGIAGALVGNLSIVGGYTFGGEALSTDGNALRVVADTALPMLLVIFSLASSAFIASVCLSARGAGWPSWIVYFGWVAALAGVFGVLFLPTLVVLLWYLAAAIVGLTRADTLAGEAATA